MSQIDDVARAGAEYLASPLAQFRPWRTPEGRAPQLDFIRAAKTHRRRSYRGGNQTGKTTVVAVDIALRLCGWHPFARQRGPVHGWWSCLDWEFGVGQIAWPKLKRWLPAGWKAAWMRRGDPEIPTTIVLPNGSRLDFKSAEAGREKYQGASLDFVALDEEHPAEIIEEIRMRLVARGGDLFWGLTPIGRERWVLDMERDPATAVVRASTLDAARAGLADLAEVQAIADGLPDRQRRVRIEGEHASLEGLVYPEFGEQTHVLRPDGSRLVTYAGEARYPWPLPPTWQRYAAMDFGYSHPTAIVQAAVDPGDGTVVVERVPYASGIRASRWAELIPALIPHTSLAAAVVADPSAADERAELSARGIGTFAAENSILTGVETVERYLTLSGRARPKLYFVVHRDPPRHAAVGRLDAHALVNELHGYQYPRQDGSGAAKKDLPIKRGDDACDALRYLLTYIERSWGGPPVIRFGESEVETIERRPIFG